MAPYQIPSCEQRQLRTVVGRPPRGSTSELTFHGQHVRRQEGTMRADKRAIIAMDVVSVTEDSDICRRSKSNSRMRSLEEVLRSGLGASPMRQDKQDCEAIASDLNERLCKSGDIGVMMRDPSLCLGDFVAGSKFKDTLEMPQSRTRSDWPETTRAATPSPAPRVGTAQTSGYTSARTALLREQWRWNPPRQSKENPGPPPVKVRRNLSYDFQEPGLRSPLGNSSPASSSGGASETGRTTPTSTRSSVPPSFQGMHQSSSVVAAAVEFYARSHHMSGARGAAESEAGQGHRSWGQTTPAHRHESSFRETLDALAGQKGRGTTEGNSGNAQGSLVSIKEMASSKSGPLVLWPSRNPSSSSSPSTSEADEGLRRAEAPPKTQRSLSFGEAEPAQEPEWANGKVSPVSTGRSRSNEQLSTSAEESDSVGSSAELESCCAASGQQSDHREEEVVEKEPSAPARAKPVSRRRTPSLTLSPVSVLAFHPTAAAEGAEVEVHMSESQGSTLSPFDSKVVDGKKKKKNKCGKEEEGEGEEEEEEAWITLFPNTHLENLILERAARKEGQRNKGRDLKEDGGAAVHEDVKAETAGERRKAGSMGEILWQLSSYGMEDGSSTDHELEEGGLFSVTSERRVQGANKSSDRVHMHHRAGSQEQVHMPRMSDILRGVPPPASEADRINNSVPAAAGTPKVVYVKRASLSHSGSLMSRCDSLSNASSCATPKSSVFAPSVSLEPGVISESGVVDTELLKTISIPPPPPQYSAFGASFKRRSKSSAFRIKVQKKWYAVFMCGTSSW